MRLKLSKIIIFSFLILASVAQGAILSSQAGRVQNNYLTTRQVLMNALAESALDEKRALTQNQVNISALDLNKPRSREFIRQTTAALVEWAVFIEAQSFSSAEITAAQVKKAKRDVVKKINANPQLRSRWNQIQPTDGEIQALLERKLRAKKFIQFKIESSALPVTDKEAHDYFEANRLQFEDLPFEKFKPKIKELISRQQVDRRIKDWFELLHSKYKIHNELAE
jgi:hypothetical protein